MLSGKTDTGITSATPTGSYAVLYSVYGYDPETGKAGIQVKVSDISDVMNLRVRE